MPHRGVTLTELLVAVSILLVVAGLIFALTPGPRESARQANCMQNLKQIYAALALYCADAGSPSGALAAGAVCFTCGGSILPYLNNRACLHCPTAPPAIKARFFSTYVLKFNSCPASLSSPLPRTFEPPADERTMEEILGPQQALATCTIHDELVYAPSESDIDPKLATPFRIHLRSDGSVFKGRDPHDNRHFLFSKGL